MAKQWAADTRPNADTNVRQLTAATRPVNLNMEPWSAPTRVAAMLDELAVIPGLGGVMLTFDEFVSGTELFGLRIQPLMHSRRHIATPHMEAAQ